MSQTDHDCPICLFGGAKVSWLPGGVDGSWVECPRCGSYEISRTLSSMNLEELYGSRWLLSAAIRNRFENGGSVTLSTSTVETLLKTTRPPTDPFQSIKLLIRHLHRKAERPGSGVLLDMNTDFPLVYARDPAEFLFYIDKARGLGLVEAPHKQSGFILTLEGWRWLLDLQKSDVGSDQAFVAMWFDPSLSPAYTEGFAPALEACGYRPIKVDLLEHNDKIDDRIISEIRRSGLLIADFTGHRGGVYFEAGFAMGLGIPVVWTCRSSDIKRAHFDTRQYNHVVWSEPADLKDKLVNRIRATVPRST